MALTQQQIDASNALLQQGNGLGTQASQVSGQTYTPIPLSILNSDAPPIVPAQPEIPPIPLVAPPAEETTPATPKSDNISSMIEDALGLQNNVAGAEDYRNQLLQQQGLTPVTDEQGNITYQNQTLNNLQGQLKRLTAESLQIPLQLQQDFTGRGVTKAGLQPIEMGALRTNAIASLGVQAQIAGQKDNIILARNAIDQMVKVKYGADEAKLKAKLANIDLLLKDPSLKAEEQDRANAQALKLKKQELKLQQNQEDTSTIASWAIAMGKYTPTDITQSKPTSLEIDNVMRLAQSDDPDKLKKALSIYAKYSADPQDTLKAANELEIQRLTIQQKNDEIALDKALSPTQVSQAKANLALTNANIAKAKAEAAALAPLPVGTGTNQAYNNAFNSAVLGLTKSSQEIAKRTFSRYLANNDLDGARQFLVSMAVEGLPAADQTQALGRAQGTASLKEISALLEQAKKKGSGTNIVSGNLVNIAQKLGATNDPDLSYLGARIQQQLQIYRRSMTGVAFSPMESAEYTKIFPDITNIDTLNEAKIKALTDSFDSNNRSTLQFKLGGAQNYNQIFGEPTLPSLPSQGGVLRSPDGTQQVSLSELTAAQIQEAKNAGWLPK